MAANRREDGGDTLLVSLGQALIAIPLEIDGREVECYFADEESADAAISEDDLALAMDAIGAWSDLDWDELEGALERNRHANTPTPPIVP
ncbi:MAG TPA: hypothetical protein VEX37_15430 [Thermomicrobiales bacterium]|nr:hypothetical protein [Thermomicrobiales bacterium]